MNAAPTTASISLQAEPGPVVPATILGQNLEVTEKNALGMLSNRLFNAKFSGPAETNGAPPPWRWANDFQMTTSAWLDTGTGLAPLSSSQVMQNYRHGGSGWSGLDPQLMQTVVEVVAGETVEIVMWARVRHEPATLLLSVNNARADLAPYGQQEIVVDTTYWKRYRVEFAIPRSDPAAVVKCAMKGRGMVWIDQLQLRRAGEGVVSEEVRAALADFPLPALRFPGGCLASNYRWRLGTGPVEHRASMFDTANRRLISYDFGTDEYLELCLEKGIRPHITVNIGSGSVAEAGQWAAYVADWFRDRGPEVTLAYFQVGNEDNGLHEHSNMTPEMYAQALRDYVPEIRANHPHVSIIALAEDFGRSLDSDETPWRATVLPVVAELGIETVAMHIYEGVAMDDPLAQCEHAVIAIASARERFASLLSDCESAGVECRVAVTEWNYRYSASHWDGPRGYERSGGTMHEDFHAPHAIFTAGFIEMLADASPRVEVANFYNLMNGMGMFSRRGAHVVPSAIVDVFALYGAALPARRVEVQIDGGSDDRLGVLALAGDTADWLYLVNRDPRDARAVSLSARAFDHAELTMLAAAAPDEKLVPTEPPAVAASTVTLPPLSILRVRWERS